MKIPLCQFIINSDNIWECSICHRTCKNKPGHKRSEIPPTRNCFNISKVKENGLTKLVRHYAMSLVQWTKAGFPVRTKEQVEILYEICKKCDKFVEERCSICRCTIKRKLGIFIKNKAALKTEKCPHPDGSKWPSDRSFYES
jgi:hypothetical protein